MAGCSLFKPIKGDRAAGAKTAGMAGATIAIPGVVKKRVPTGKTNS